MEQQQQLVANDESPTFNGDFEAPSSPSQVPSAASSTNDFETASSASTSTAFAAYNFLVQDGTGSQSGNMSPFQSNRNLPLTPPPSSHNGFHHGHHHPHESFQGQHQILPPPHQQHHLQHQNGGAPHPQSVLAAAVAGVTVNAPKHFSKMNAR